MFSFAPVYPDLGYWYVIWKDNSTNRVEFEKHSLYIMPQGRGFHTMPVFCFDTFSGDLYFDAWL